MLKITYLGRKPSHTLWRYVCIQYKVCFEFFSPHTQTNFKARIICGRTEQASDADNL